LGSRGGVFGMFVEQYQTCGGGQYSEFIWEYRDSNHTFFD